MSAASLRRAVRPLVGSDADADEVVRLAKRHLEGQGAGFDFEPWMDPDNMPGRTHDGLPER